ncbi:sensory transduction histidine kinase [Gluconacetobacter sacchari DSM 12717]|uniref:histidine kinase n=2 Tax=Gluconacetobacter sacchari TaxID=92759 RepID=A0A7W4I9L6_9PROT|nr:PAS domain-containing protein [Gluconacetobacter sacchari]MBB2158793.1 PAS domain-containing protein [Gluconacetobacter sacchari]GBQ23969.1 sensory transduction histidine kinase [Gluconacetobacter sacchari DSM 12717]
MPQDVNSLSDTGYQALDLIADMVCVGGRDGSVAYFNRAWRDYGPGFAAPRWMDWIAPAERPRVALEVRNAVGSGERFETDLPLVHPAGGARWFLLRVRPLTLPDGAAAAPRWLLSLTDIDARKRRELDLLRDTRIQAEMLNASIDCIKLVRPDGTLSHLNKAGCAALNVAEDGGFGMEWLGLLPREAHQAGWRALQKARRGENARFLGVSQVPGQDPRYWDNMLTPLKNGGEQVEAILCVSRDVTAQRASERRIAALLHEVTHRSKNMLAIVLALIRRTVPDAQAPFVAILGQRIAAIARNQDLLINGQWSGITVETLLASQTAVMGDVNRARLLLHGAAGLRLLPETAERVGLAIHELTTNAIKYGALSNDGGTVAIDWGVEARRAGDVFRLVWRESGGPPVREPAAQGFGTAVIERNPRALPGASVVYRYEPDGVTWMFEAPVSSVVDDVASRRGAVSDVARMD